MLLLAAWLPLLALIPSLWAPAGAASAGMVACAMNTAEAASRPPANRVPRRMELRLSDRSR